MPKRLEKMVTGMTREGMAKSRAYAIATSYLQKKGIMPIKKKKA
jgi:hypothetical protein